MQTITILGDGALGRAVQAAVHERDRGSDRPPETRILGRPPSGRHRLDALGQPDLVVEASRSDAVVANIEAAVAAGGRRLVIATTGWADNRSRVEQVLREAGAAAVHAPNFSLGVALFARLVETAVELFGSLDAFDPYLLEWHRRAKRDRPSGTALDLAERIADRHPRLGSAADLEVVSVRAGSSPGMHLVGFDAPGETIELRLTARDRSAYAAGILAAADWLERSPREPGLHAFDLVVDELIAARQPIAA
jgi:4-hydroxy-tetrahydrodipicolinate reductase